MKQKHFIEEVKHNHLINKKPKIVCKVLNYIKRLLILASDITGFVPISVFASLYGIPVGIVSFAVEWKIYVVTARVKMCKLIIEKKRKNSMMK